MLLLLLSRFSHVRLCATPQMEAHQAPPSLGFSRQEHWSGLPFPSPLMRYSLEINVITVQLRRKGEVNSYKVISIVLCCAQSLSHVQLFATPWTVANQASLSMGFPRQEYWSGLQCPPPGDLPHPGIEPRFPALQMDSLSSEPPWKPKNTGTGSLSLLQGIFPIQESNQCHLHCS